MENCMEMFSVVFNAYGKPIILLHRSIKKILIHYVYVWTGNKTCCMITPTHVI